MNAVQSSVVGFDSGYEATAAVAAKSEVRVLHVFSVLSVGGAETWLMALLKYFREADGRLPVKVACDILLTGGAPAFFDEEAKTLGARLFYVPFSRRHPFKFMREFRRILAAGNYDVIHDHQDYMAGLHLLMGLGLLPANRIAHVHNPFYQRTNNGQDLIRRLAGTTGKRLIGQLATHVMGTSRQIVSEYGFDRYASRGVSVGVVNCGFDVAKFQGDRERVHADLCRELDWPRNAKIILFVGRLEADEVFNLGRVMTHKNPAFALEVMKECISRDSDVRLVMVGAGEAKRREFESAANEWSMGRQIRLLGVRSDVPRLMLGANLLLFPSLAEGLGMVVIEAQAAGLPVLASDTTPRECVVVPGLVDFMSLAETPGHWAAKALSLLNSDPTNPDTCNATVRDSSFSIERSAAKLLSIYRPDKTT